jgi:CoA:oxalate CoA-transferase
VQPLQGLRIVDLTRVLSGPFCTMLLADLGADVIKVETPEGDLVRRQGAGRDGLSWYYAAFNRNKRSVVVDLKKPEGKAVLEKLIAGADAIVENFRPGVLDRLGFDDCRLQELRPGLVVCAISGFGPDGPYRDRPAFDFIAQAMSGFMSVNGRPEDPPLRTGLPISDLVAGLYGALGIVSALLGRKRGNEDEERRGERIDVSLTSSMVSLLAYIASHYFATGEVLPRTGNDHPIAAPYGLFRTKDGEIAIAPSDDTFFGRLMDALELPEAKNDPDFADNRLRVAHRTRLNALVEEKLMERDSRHWVEVLNAAGVPCGPVYGVDKVFSDPQIASQNMAISIEHPGYGPVRMLGFPIRLKQEPCTVRLPAPRLGEHTDEILAELGVSPSELESLREKGAVA